MVGALVGRRSPCSIASPVARLPSAVSDVDYSVQVQVPLTLTHFSHTALVYYYRYYCSTALYSGGLVLSSFTSTTVISSPLLYMLRCCQLL